MDTTDIISKLNKTNGSEDAAIAAIEGAGWQVDRNYAEEGSLWGLLDSTGHRHVVEYVASTDTWELAEDAPLWLEEDEVEGGETAEDYDWGEVIDVDGDRVTVAWRQSETTTTQRADVLRARGTRVL